MSRPYPRTNDDLASVTLRLSMAGAAAGRHRLRVPLGALSYDQRLGQAARFLALVAPRFDAPAGVRLLSVTPYASAAADDPRAAVVAGVDLLLEVQAGAADFTARPLVLFGHGAANECEAASLVMPAVVATTGAPWAVGDGQGAPIGVVWEAPW